MARIGVKSNRPPPSLITVHSPSDCVTVACRAMHTAGGPLPGTELSEITGCSIRQLQRDFADVLGVSPRQYGASVRAMTARHTLRTSPSITDAIYDAGYGSVRAFYEKATKQLGMTPADFAAGAPQHVLLWSSCDSVIGRLICVAGPRGICLLLHGTQAGGDEARIHEEFPHALLERDDAAMRDVMRALQLIAAGTPAPQLPVDVAGTAFQARVWAALREIPYGETRSYADIAEEIGEPTAIRAVGSACGANRVPLSIPCHRVVRTDGTLGGFGWGLEVKEELLTREGSLYIGSDQAKTWKITTPIA
jgi:AraC family transcriptional regulator of adaptative response/methylated-DNA-[protein]-cysteine methyltransferase